MIFYGVEFLLFFTIFLGAFFLFKKGSARTWYILLASYVFYLWWYPPYLLLLVGISVLAFGGGLVVGRSRLALPLTIVALLLPLGVFKYAGFVIENLSWLTDYRFVEPREWVLPLGISFITFTAISYVIDVSRGLVVPERRFRQIGLFIAFFPQLVAGPILRDKELMPQLRRIGPRLSMLPFGALLFAFGAIKKVVLADGIGVWVDQIYGGDVPLTAGESLLAIYGFTAQIYCDFSGYTDMALGLGAFLGVWLPRNFERPYLADSVREFWRRWHMTLSRWLRDYLYIPLGGNRFGPNRMLAAVMTTMLLGGLWHGASWTFVLWGGVHGAAIVAEHLRSMFLPRLPAPPVFIRRLIVVHFVAFTWILFRSEDMGQVGAVIQGLLVAPDWQEFARGAVWPILLIGIVMVLHPFDSISRVRLASRKLPAPVAIAVAIMALTLCLALSIGNPGTFIYFDF